MNEPKLELDLLRGIETLTERLNSIMGKGGESVFRRYPVTFTLLVLFGVVAVSEGIKGILENLNLFNGNPWSMLVLGLIVLVFTGTLYKKLDK